MKSEMFGFLKRRTTQSESDAETATLLASFADHRLFILSLNPSGDFKGDINDTEQVIAWLDQNARETGASDRSIDIYLYEENGQRLMPFFSSSASVSAFIASDPAHKWKAFTNAGLTGRALFQYLAQATFSGAKVVLNPRTDSECFIPARVLHTILGGNKG